jgi:hypothetical protein
MNLLARQLPLLLAALTLPLSQVLFQGCATMIDGPTQKVHVNSEPAGAKVFVNGRPIGNTPATAVVSRWGMHRVRIEMAGYKPLEVSLEKKFNDYAGDNILLGGVWIVVDAVTGAIFRLDVPADKRAELHPGSQYAGAIFSPTILTISATLKPDSTARKIGQMQRE